MSYLNKTIIAILIVVGAYFNEYYYLSVDPSTEHSTQLDRNGNEYQVYLDDAVYYFVNSLFILLLVLSVFLLTPRGKIASKVILFGVLTWFSIELIENYQFLANINVNALIINNWSVWQICITSLSTTGSYFYFTKFKL